ncbi:MAG TPA: hypothetical protein VKM00_02240, partial [Luteimonas sp.]|nr:hypothetical protein [Luteimonas sp.]
LAYAGLRLSLVNSIPLNSDEPQHAHVAWAWSRGLVPYRDVFDNHAPLFHMLFAPVMRLIGERPDVMTWLRVGIVPIAVAALAVVAWIARRLWSRDVAFWAVVMLCAIPPYLREAGTFRTDALWAVAWLGTVAVATAGPWTRRRAFAFGVLLGISFAVSMKTSLLLGGLSIAWLAAFTALRATDRPPPSTWLRDAGAILAGATVVPGLIVGWVGLRGGLAAMHYGVIAHNVLPSLGRTHGTHWRLPLMLVLLGVLAWLVRRAVRASGDGPLAARRSLVVASAVAYTLLLFGTWPLLSRQDMLPSLPLITLGVAAWWQAHARARVAWLPVPLAILAAAVLMARHPPWNDRLVQERAALADVLAITTVRDTVMDDKGAAIFRMRPFYFALEGITRARIDRGLIVDDIPQRLVATNTHVVLSEWLPPRDARFVTTHYISARNGLMVSGHDFGHLDAGSTVSASLLQPGRYALVPDPAADPLTARIDGNAYDGARWLAAGPHTLAVARPGHYVLAWQPAAKLFPGAEK